MSTARLNIYTNELDKDQVKQNEQISLALQDVSSWSKKINSSILLDLADDTAQSITSTNYTNLNGYTSSFKSTNPTIRIDVLLALNLNGNNATIGINIDGTVRKEIKVSSAGNVIIPFWAILNLAPGQHTLNIQMKTASGTINKILNGGSQVVVTNTL